MGNEWKTAGTRYRPSAPMKRLAADNRLVGFTLDYGCGKGYDAHYYGMESYDPYFQPDMPIANFDTITCNYVLNVIESPVAREAVVQDIRSRLNPGGIAYITVRNDRRALNGTTKIRTWQGLITLDLPVVYKTSGFITYEVRNEV